VRIEVSVDWVKTEATIVSDAFAADRAAHSEDRRRTAEELPCGDPEPLILALEFLPIIAAVAQLAQLATDLAQLSVDNKQRMREHRRRVHEQLSRLDESLDSVRIAAHQFGSLLDYFSLRDKKPQLGRLERMMTAQEASEFVRLYHDITVGGKRIILGTINLSKLVHNMSTAEAKLIEALQQEADSCIQEAVRSSTYQRFMVKVAAGLSTLDRALDPIAQNYHYERHSSSTGAQGSRPF
jgi:hypothetical protein